MPSGGGWMPIRGILSLLYALKALLLPVRLYLQILPVAFLLLHFYFIRESDMFYERRNRAHTCANNTLDNIFELILLVH